VITHEKKVSYRSQINCRVWSKIKVYNLLRHPIKTTYIVFRSLWTTFEKKTYEMIINALKILNAFLKMCSPRSSNEDNKTDLI